jgi:hypothetical protein
MVTANSARNGMFDCFLELWEHAAAAKWLWKSTVQQTDVDAVLPHCELWQA